MDDFLTSYSEAIQALFARTTGGIKPGLERTEALLAELGSPQRKLSAIHVAGTNGKGSVVANCEALLRARGFKVGKYTSPHLIDFRERITVDGVPIPEAEVYAFLKRWIPTAVDLGATFFEITTTLAFDWLARSEVDFCVIETGLGGRLDSTNVLLPLAATVTSIGLDHTDLLGDTLQEIAREKAGIFKPGVPAVIGEASLDIRELLVRCAADVGARPIVAVDECDAIEDVNVSPRGTTFTLVHGGDRQRLSTPLLGAYQARNTATAIATLASIDDGLLPPRGVMSRALAKIFLPGRFQRRGRMIFDVAHNPDGARMVSKTITELNLPRPRTALVAILSDKDWRSIIEALAAAVDRFVFTIAPSAPTDRRWNPDHALAFATAQGFDARSEPDLDAALAAARKNRGTLLVTGSFHTVGDVMSRLHVSPFAA